MVTPPFLEKINSFSLLSVRFVAHKLELDN